MAHCSGFAYQECQFPRSSSKLYEFEGGIYCLFHLPPNGQTDASWLELKHAIESLCVDHKHWNFDGVTFPDKSFQFRGQPQWSFEHCSFGSGKLDFPDQHMLDSIRFNHCKGRSKLKITAQDVLKFYCTEATFHASVDVTLRSPNRASKTVDFSKTIFNSTLNLSYTDTPVRLRFDRCLFGNAPDFSQVEKLPQRTFFKATFAGTAIHGENEGRFRHIRNLFHANRARDDEGAFYALEKRCQRQSLGWRPLRNGVAKVFSTLYDVLSEYGQSYERAVGWLIGLQVVAGFAYSIALGRMHFSWTGEFDVDVFRFTLAQVVKPFEAFAARGISGWTTELLGREPSGWWLLGITLHSIISLVLLALFFLALRWRFRRE